MAKVEVKFNDEKQIVEVLVGEKIKYEFWVKRKKDEKTGLEVMEIQVRDAENAEFLGTIYTRYLDIRTNIIELQNYGVSLERLELWGVADEIRANYAKITPHKTQYINNHVSEAVTEEFFEMICECIENEKRKPQNETYNIEPDTLKRWYADSNFRMFSLTELKEELAALGYTKTNKNRNDNTIKEGGSAKKVYSFWANKVNEILEKKEEE